MFSTGLDINYNDVTVDKIMELKNFVISEYGKFADNLLLLQKDKLCWDSYIEPEMVLDSELSLMLPLLKMSSFHKNKEIRDACSTAESEIEKFAVELSMRKDLFEQFKYYYNNNYKKEKEELSTERQKYVEDKMIDYKRDGLDLDDEKYQQIKEINLQLAEMSNKFDNNLNNCTDFYVFSKEELLGLEEVNGFLEKRKLNDTDTYKITLKYPDYLPVMEYCKVRNTRKVIATAFNSRCVKENLPLCVETFKLRLKKAQLLGYEQYSDYVLEKRMAKTTSNVMNFLIDLKNKMKSKSAQDLVDLQKISSEMGQSENIELYDIAYYSRLFTEKNSDLNDEKLKSHFPVDVVTAGLFETYSTLFGYKFVDITESHKDKLWDDDVKLFKTIDTKTDKSVGYFYLDLYPREGKYGHCAVFPFVTQNKYSKPICAMVCNFEKNSNLPFDFVETYFHEFGHVMHQMSSNVELARYGGTHCSRDFVEAPSQMLEEFCYRPNILKKISVELSDADIEKINKRRKLLQGYYNERQISFGMYDMMLHSKNINEILGDDYEHNLYKLFNDITKDTVGINAIENTNMVASFGHIMHGYESAYYGYMYSKVFAKDMFETKFYMNELNPEIGMSYRQEILSVGGCRSELESLKLFLGREPNNDAFVKSLE